MRPLLRRLGVAIVAYGVVFATLGCSQSEDSNILDPGGPTVTNRRDSGGSGDIATDGNGLRDGGGMDGTPDDRGGVVTDDVGGTDSGGGGIGDLGDLTGDGGPNPNLGGPGTTTPEGERCDNGLDDNGNGQVDEGCLCVAGRMQRCFVGDPRLAGRGVCTLGSQSCMGEQSDGNWGACAGSGRPLAEVCNGKDDNCNGTIDEGCSCTAGQTRMCYGGPSGTNGRGACRGGTQSCIGNAWGPCAGQVLPSAETCDGMDRDCDGNASNGCSCAPGQFRGCFSGPPASAMVGACRPGRENCIRLESGGTVYGPCSGDVLPTAEICDDMIDNDCNGMTDCADQDCRGAPNCVPGCRMGTVGELRPRQAEIAFILDRSGSMSASAGGTSRWGAVRTAVNLVLPRVQGSFGIGLSLFPVSGTCQVAPGLQFPIVRGSSMAISTFLELYGPNGNTPTQQALSAAISYFRGNASTEPRFVLLATDGMPNCGQDVGSVTRELQTLRGMSIDTFVLGIPGPRDALNAMADAGGRARTGSTRFYEANNTTELVSALRVITAAVANCEYDLPSPPAPIANPALLRITFDAVTVAQGADGWAFTDATNRRVRFAGSACTTLRGGMVSRIAALYNCSP